MIIIRNYDVLITIYLILLLYIFRKIYLIAIIIIFLLYITFDNVDKRNIGVLIILFHYIKAGPDKFILVEMPITTFSKQKILIFYVIIITV